MSQSGLSCVLLHYQTVGSDECLAGEFFLLPVSEIENDLSAEDLLSLNDTWINGSDFDSELGCKADLLFQLTNRPYDDQEYPDKAGRWLKYKIELGALSQLIKIDAIVQAGFLL
jgi:hypothetical protein